ncbi:MAG: hypothetical protein M3Q32_01010 [Pseudomonadota bacterium]|nr:hypothetical protein [Burkholderiales bacterium]MDQ3194976.1 hypothetical protein [Pseudomonadota bacterium]
MDNELSALEDRISEVAEVCRQLRAENARLKEQIAAADLDKKRLAQNMETARSRLETLLRQMPQGTEV